MQLQYNIISLHKFTDSSGRKAEEHTCNMNHITTSTYTNYCTIALPFSASVQPVMNELPTSLKLCTNCKNTNHQLKYIYATLRNKYSCLSIWSTTELCVSVCTTEFVRVIESVRLFVCVFCFCHFMFRDVESYPFYFSISVRPFTVGHQHDRLCPFSQPARSIHCMCLI